MERRTRASAAGRDVEVLSGAGVVDQLAGIVAGFDPHRVLVVGSTTGLARADVARRLRGYQVRYFTDFTSNPQLTDVLAGCAIVESYRPDVVLGVGGGSALDVAKMVRLLPSQPGAALAALASEPAPAEWAAPLVLVPTTAGTGAEVTRFATVYVHEVKHSLDHPGVRADVALVDPELTHTCPADVTYSCALDALAHAVESAWSTRSTPQSRTLALDALGALVPVLDHAGWPLTREARRVLSGAAMRAGLAIDITRTTGAHAFAYPLTARYGVPHGLACALNLAWLLPLTWQRLGQDCQDPRGKAFAERRLKELATGLGAGGAEDTGAAVASFVAAAGFETRLGAYGVREGDLPWLVHAGLRSGRSTGGPVRLDPEAVLGCLARELQAV